MPRTARTPPQASSNLVHVQSEPDMTSFGALEMEPESVPIATRRRAKRPRTDDTSVSEFIEFKNDIKSMLDGWKSDLDSALSQIKEVATWKTDLKSALSKLDTNVNELKEKCSTIQHTNSEIEKSIEFLNSNFDGLQEKIKGLEKERSEQRECIAHLEKQIHDLQLGPRPAAIEIRNLPAEDKETPVTLCEVVCGVSSAIGAVVQPTDLRDVYRMPPSKPGAIKTIVAEFHSVQAKNAFLAQSRQFNRARPASEKLSSKSIGRPGEQRPIYVDDHLPPMVRKLFFKARDFAKSNNYKYCWTANGRIFLRKNSDSNQLNVRSEKCLEQIPLLY